MTCRCGASGKTAAKHSFRRTVAGTTFTAAVDVEACAGCGDVYVPASLMIAFERAIAAELARSGPITDETFRWLRKAAGVERNELAQILGVTPETLAGWESERRPVDRAAWLVVASLALDGVEGPRALRPRLASATSSRPAPTERTLDLPPGGLVTRLLGILAGPNEFTDAELADALDLDLVALRRVLGELADHGLVRSTSEAEPKRWTPSTREHGALLAAALRAGIDLDPPVARSSRNHADRARSHAPAWRPTST